MLFKSRVRRLEEKVEELIQYIWVQTLYINQLENELNNNDYYEGKITRLKEIEAELNKLCEISQEQKRKLEDYRNELDKLRSKMN